MCLYIVLPFFLCSQRGHVVNILCERTDYGWALVERAGKVGYASSSHYRIRPATVAVHLQRGNLLHRQWRSVVEIVLWESSGRTVVQKVGIIVMICHHGPCHHGKSSRLHFHVHGALVYDKNSTSIDRLQHLQYLIKNILPLPPQNIVKQQSKGLYLLI